MKVPHKIAVAAALCLAPPLALSVQEDAAGLGDTRTALEEWMENQRLISLEKRDWDLAKELLQDQIDLVQDRIDTIQEGIEKAATDTSELDAQRLERVEEHDGLKASADALLEVVIDLERRVTALLKRLPEPLLERVRVLSQRIPTDPENTEASLSDRYMSVIGILNAVNKFNGEITTNSERRELPDGSKAEVSVMYVGLGQAYYVGADKTVAGVGRPGEEGWVWTPANESAADIALALAIFNNEKVADFVPLPLEVQ